ncbi:MAG: mechanosensitive ion channel [Reyranella sp.]|nr:mechanosensitive ion channel [Reyranella sp.]
MQSRKGLVAVAGGLIAAWALPVVAQVAEAKSGGSSFLDVITAKLEVAISHFPALIAHLLRLPEIISGARTALLLAAIVIAGLAAEYIVRLVLRGVRVRALSNASPVQGFVRAFLFDAVALAALWIAGRLVVGQMGDSQSIGGRLGQQLLMVLVYWRGFNLVFRAWLRPDAPVGRIAPVDDTTARRLMVALNLLIVLPLADDYQERVLKVTGAGPHAIEVSNLFFTVVVSLGLLAVVWHWRREMAAWLAAMVGENALARQLKLDMARNWWMVGLAFYGFTGVAELYGELMGNEAAPAGMDVIESLLIGLLLFETLMYRVTHHVVSELPMAGDVAADCLRLAVRLYAAILIVNAFMVQVVAAATPAEWAPHDRGAKIAAISAVLIYALWRFIRYRMDSYVAANPLPSADAGGDAEDDVKVSASRLRTLMPLLRVVAGVTIAVVGTLLVLSELGINITPLIAGASVLGLAVSFGSQSLVRDVVSGVFFLAEDSFRIGEYLDCGRVKGTVEGFSVRSLRLRHQNGQLHIVPFGQVGHITNFSRDWTAVKFSLAFAHGTDIELVRKTVKKMGLDMMEEAQFKSVLLQPLKMQGVVDIKDSTVILRFKYMAKPNNPGVVQRIAVRRMYDKFPALGIQFAQGTTTFQMPMGGFAPAPAPASTAAPAAKAAE